MARLFINDLLTVDFRRLSLLMAWVILNGTLHACLELAPFGFFTPIETFVRLLDIDEDI